MDFFSEISPFFSLIVRKNRRPFFVESQAQERSSVEKMNLRITKRISAPSDVKFGRNFVDLRPFSSKFR